MVAMGTGPLNQPVLLASCGVIAAVGLVWDLWRVSSFRR
jgi:hypothetical protein